MRQLIVDKGADHQVLTTNNAGDIPLPEKERFLKEYVDLIGTINSTERSPKWWSYCLNSKDYVNSTFYDELFETIGLVNKIDDSDAENIVVVVGSQRVAAQIKYYCEKRDSQVVMSGVKAGSYSSIFSLARPLISSLSFLWQIYYRIAVCALFLRGRILFVPARPGAKRYVIRSWATTNSLVSAPDRDLYFGSLQNDLTARGFDVGVIVGVLGDYLKAVKIMKAHDKPLPQEILLSVLDPLLTLLSCRFRPSRVNGPVYFRTIDISLLLNSCLALERSSGQDLHNMLYYRIGRRLGRRYQPELCSFSHENYPWEKTFILGFRSAAKTFLIGYQHSGLYRSLTTVLLSKKEKGRVPLPDAVVTVGEITKGYLATEGNYDPRILRTGCSLSAAGGERPVPARPLGKNLLVILGCYPRAAAMLDFVVTALKGSDFHLILRPHPVAPLHEYADKLAFDLAQANDLEISTGPLRSDLARSAAVLYDGSKAALEALEQGLPVINICPFHDIISYDPLIKCPVFKWSASSKESLMSSLNGIFSMDSEAYERQAKQAVRYSREYIGEKNDNCLAQFMRQGVSVLLEEIVEQTRIVKVSPDFTEVLGTDRGEDANRLFGPEYAAYRRAWSENPKNKLVADFPLHLDLETSNTCNLRCSMCQIPFGKMQSGYMDKALYKKILAEIKGNHLPSVKFNFRGEPLMHPDLVDFVRLAKEAGILEVQFNSNGSLLTDELSKGLIEAGLSRIKFSVDGVTPDVYNSIRKGTSYDVTIPKILRFIELRNSLGKKLPSVQVQMVYMSSNSREAAEYIKFWEDKANRIGFSRYRSGSNKLGEAGRVSEMGRRIPCSQLYQRMVVLWDGTMLMCCGDHQMRSPIGNALKDNIVDVWRGEKLKQYRQLHEAGKYDEVPACVGCEVNYL
ncbi:radical SAM protein [Candidatus Saganbacteria bacterium]|nr:radical SAM protein [Candidatus Saganbacteria bacterium]